MYAKITHLSNTCGHDAYILRNLSFCRGSRVEGRGFHVEGEGTMSRVEGKIFFPILFLEKVKINVL